MLRNAPRTLERQAVRKCLQGAVCRRPTFTPRNMVDYFPSVRALASHFLPADSYQVLPTNEKAGSAEDALFDQEIKDVNEWWATERYLGIKRPYSAEDVVSKRGTLQQSYPSSLMARKLFTLFQEKSAVGEPVHTSASYLSTSKSCGPGG